MATKLEFKEAQAQLAKLQANVDEVNRLAKLMSLGDVLITMTVTEDRKDVSPTLVQKLVVTASINL